MFYFSLSLRDRLPDRDPLGADGQTVARGFDVAPGDDLAILRLERRTDAEFRKRRVCVLPHRDRRVDQLLIAVLHCSCCFHYLFPHYEINNYTIKNYFDDTLGIFLARSFVIINSLIL